MDCTKEVEGSALERISAHDVQDAVPGQVRDKQLLRVEAVVREAASDTAARLHTGRGIGQHRIRRGRTDHGCDAEEQHQRIVINVIDARLAQLWAETNQCVSSPLYVVETVGRTVVSGDASSCTSFGPLMDDEDASLLGMHR